MRPLSLSTPIWTYRFAGLRLHPDQRILGSGLLVISVGEALRVAVTERLAAHKPSPVLRLQGIFAWMARVFQSLPNKHDKKALGMPRGNAFVE
jgi:hypothetical protein